MAEQTENTGGRPVAQSLTIKVYPDEIERFKSMKSTMDGVNTDRQAFVALMDYFENPPKSVIKDNPALTQRIAELEAEAQRRTEEMTALREENERLKAKASELQQTANDNGQASSELQLRIEQLEAENAALREKKNLPENVISVEVHPVPWYFLKKMAESETKRKGEPVAPGTILTDLFVRDLQNPRSNNLPYIVSSSEIKEVSQKYEASMKKKQEAEQKEVKNGD